MAVGAAVGATIGTAELIVVRIAAVVDVRITTAGFSNVGGHLDCCALCLDVAGSP
jgi:hypothetical protein